MAWTCDEVLAVLGDDAQAVSSGITTVVTTTNDEGVEAKKHVLVGRFDGLSFILTADGTELLEKLEQPEPVAKKARSLPKPKKVEAVVEDSNELVDDLNLDV